MKKILVPSDFSENAERALQYAIHIANAFGGDITLFHAFQLGGAGAGRFANVEELVEKDREEELAAIVNKYKGQLADTVRLHGKVVEDYAVDAIAAEAKREPSNYVVMGTTGASGIKKVFMGSIASNVIRNTNAPVLAVPDDAAAFSLKNILIALDAEEMEDAAILNPALDLALKFGATVSILHITDEKNDDISPKVQAYFKQMNIAHAYYKLHTDDAKDGILDFAKQKNMDLICVLNRHRSWFSQLFQSSMSQKLAFETTIPLLALHAE